MVLSITSHERTELIDITQEVQSMVSAGGIKDGICLVFVPHTTAAVTINENTDPAVKSDMLMVLNRIVPWKADYRHLEGNSPAHAKATLVGPSELIPIAGGRLLLGTWQGIFFCEFDGPRNRKVFIQIQEGTASVK